MAESDSTPDPFAGEAAKGARAALEAQLQLDQFNSTNISRPYGTECLTGEINALARYTNADVRVAFVRPRVISVSFANSSFPLSLYELAAEVTRIAVLQRDVGGQWRGRVEVTRDTLLYSLNTRDSTGKWTVCGMPGRSRGYNSDYTPMTMDPWQPVNAGDAEGKYGAAWDSGMSWSRIARLADSVAKLPPDFVVEGNPEPEVPYYIRDICPWEGCSFGKWLACDTMRVFAEPKAGARTAFMVSRGDNITALTGDMHVTQAGKVVFTETKRVREEGWRFVFTPADTLYPLSYLGEGFGTWYFRGKEGGGVFFFGQGSDDDFRSRTGQGFELVRPIKSDWWVRVRGKDGREGWFVPRDSVYGTSPHYEPLPAACPEGKRK